MNPRSHRLAAALLFVFLGGQGLAAERPVGNLVTVESGTLNGLPLAGGVRAFLSVPYGAPPVGKRRWREATAPEPWTGVRDATRFGPACPQSGDVSVLGAPGISEDCLTLNVWTPPRRATRAKVPVLVYIYGGGFNKGAASGAKFNGAVLAEHGLVVVTFNYRVGIMASLALPELLAESEHHSTGALLHLDEVAALEWVRRNISAFGGDPDNVTVSGQSSGSIDVSALQASPLARGLFKHAVGMSGAALPDGGPWPEPSVAESEKVGEALERTLGVHTLEQMRQLPLATILKAANGFYFPVGPDGYFLPATPASIFAEGKQNDVSIFVGNTRDEGFSLVKNVKTVPAYRAKLSELFGPHADEIFALYPVTQDSEVPAVVQRLSNDGEFTREMATWAAAQTKTGDQPAYLYQFSGTGGGVPHGSDVTYWFGNLATAPAAGADGTTQVANGGDVRLSESMMELLISFVRGDPPHTASVSAPRYELSHPERLVLDTAPHSASLSPGTLYFIAHPNLILGIGERGMVMGPAGPQSKPH